MLIMQPLLVLISFFSYLVKCDTLCINMVLQPDQQAYFTLCEKIALLIGLLNI